MYKRTINLSKSHSFFLFGMRGSGKSTLLKDFFPENKTLWINLLLSEDFLKYRSNPDLLKNEILALQKREESVEWVVIDEVQKVPALLDVVHYLIEEHQTKFALTGSSARKLKRDGANLLAGRAFVFNLFPLSHLELEQDFDLQKFLEWGGLPALYHPELEKTEDRVRFLKAYVHTYLKEEILIEQIVRNIDPFHPFLQVSSQMNSEIINFSNIARQAGTNDKTVERYYSILEDTLLGFHLLPYNRSVRKQQVSSSKFYYLDIGLIRAIRGDIGIAVNKSSYDYGKLFESFVIGEIYKLNRYFEKDYKLSFLKTKEGVELDLIIERPHKKNICVEIKSGEIKDSSGYDAKIKLSREIPNSEFIVLSGNTKAISYEGMDVIPWQEGIKRIFNNEGHIDFKMIKML